MNRMPRIEIKTIPATAEEIERHLDTERTKTEGKKRVTRKKTEKEEEE